MGSTFLGHLRVSTEDHPSPTLHHRTHLTLTRVRIQGRVLSASNHSCSSMVVAITHQNPVKSCSGRCVNAYEILLDHMSIKP